MSRSIPRLTILVLTTAAAFGIWITTGRAPTLGATVQDADRQAIQKLHQQDIDATLAHDPQALADLFTEDAVLLEPGAPPVIGKPAIPGVVAFPSVGS